MKKLQRIATGHRISLPVFRLTLQPCMRLIATSLLLPFSLALQAQTVTPAKRFSFADLQHLKTVSDVQISPDGRAVVYSVRSVDIPHDRFERTTWILRLPEASVPVALPHTTEPSWSPDGHTLAVVNSTSDRTVVQLLGAEKLEVIREFPLPSSPDSLVWSPDGESLAFTLFVPEKGAPSSLQQSVNVAEGELEKPEGAQWAAPVQITQAVHYREDGEGWLPNTIGHRHLFVLSTVSGVLRQVGSEPFDDAEPAWFPDSKTLLFTSDRRPRHEHMFPAPAIYRTDLSGHATRLSQGDDTFSTPKVSPDGKWIAFIRIPFRLENYTRSDLYVMRTNGTDAHQLAPNLDRDLSRIAWSSDSRGVYAKFDDHGVSHVGLFDLAGHSTTLATGLEGNFSVSRTGTIAYTADSPDGPSELTLQAPNRSAQKLTSLNAFLQQRQLGRLLRLEARSHADGAPVEGWALLPPGYQEGIKAPLIVVLHGGPFGDDGPHWSSEDQLFAAAGYVVLTVNYRGSTSYGTAFSEPANHDFPGLAYDDTMSVVDQAIQQGLVDRDRLFVTGGSAGGELTEWITGKTGRFRAAAAQKPVIDDMSEALTTDQYLGALLIYEGEPWAREKELWAHSPLSLVGSVTTPTLLIVGDRDYRTPVDETLQMYDALQLRGIPTALGIVPGAGHASLLARPSQSTAVIAATLAWFRKYDSSRDASPSLGR